MTNRSSEACRSQTAVLRNGRLRLLKRLSAGIIFSRADEPSRNYRLIYLLTLMPLLISLVPAKVSLSLPGGRVVLALRDINKTSAALTWSVITIK